MRSALKALVAYIAFCTAPTSAQEKETVYVTVPDADGKPRKEYLFSQLSVAVPVRGNPYHDEIMEEYRNNGEEYSASVIDYIIPNGVSVHGGYGVHLKSWMALSANLGLDWLATEQLVSAPVYGALLFNPQIWDEDNVYLQFGFGRSFAIGRGDLSGDYIKGRIGIVRDNEHSLFLDISSNQFSLHKQRTVPSISVGLAVFAF